MATKDDIKKLAMATKDDFKRLEMNTKDDLRRLESKMATREDVRALESQIQNLNAKTVYELQSLEHRMTLKLGGLMAAFLATGLTAAKIILI